ncbi:MAG TPA: adenine phosphoribosyltransferase [Rhodanobacteraceae bacterium]
MPAWASLIRDIPDFPAPGVLFKDITPLLADARGFADCLAAMAAPWRDKDVEIICGTESRGFIFGAALAPLLGAGFVPLRKAGKLPAATVQVEYALEYGTDKLEIHRDAFAPGQRVLLVDDVLATGGTLAASRDLVERAGGKVIGASILLEIAALGGRARWGNDLPLEVTLRY